MKGFEEIGLKAFKAAEAEREENVTKLKAKVGGVAAARKEAKEADSSAQEALGGYKATRLQMAELEAEFGRMLGNETVRQYLVGQGVETLDDYAKTVGLEENETVDHYKTLKASLKELGVKLRSEVEARAEAKGHLKDELAKNDPDQKYGTFKKLNKSAEEQEMNIPKKELEALADSLVEEHRADVQENIAKLWTKEGREGGRKPYITAKDVIGLQKYGRWENFDIASRLFREKIQTLVFTLLEERIAGLDRETYASIPEMFNPDKIKYNLADILKFEWENAKSAVSRGDERFTDQIIKEKTAEMLEGVKPVLETAFTNLADLVQKNQFGGQIEGFKKERDSVAVSFATSQDRSSLTGKYFNTDYGTKGGTVYTTFGSGELSDSLARLEIDCETAKQRTADTNRVAEQFRARNVVARFLNKDEGRISAGQYRTASRDEYDLRTIKELQEGLLAFINEIKRIEEENRFSITLGSRPIPSITEFRNQYLAELEKKFGSKRN